ncbi:hypothetical protein DPMN_024663 [Dreissena polymorpha]|uniref:Uncharacterized protein n=2 Tax=Dreissena polymorpha TaxID=45954 RepID=A0A9D4LQ00_DREPO|nr:hypothetical protein DPMN_024663 [Dreissena polymorpha]
MEFLRINEMSDYSLSSCSSSEYEEMMESDIDIDDIWNKQAEMMSEIKRDIEAKFKTELADSQHIRISKVPETAYSETKPKVNEDAIATNSSIQNQRQTTALMNRHFVNDSSSQEANNETGDELQLSLLQSVNITNKKHTVFESPGSRFDKNTLLITTKKISSFMEDHKIKAVDLSAITKHTFLPLEVFGMCRSKSCKTPVLNNPYIKIPRCDENMKLFNSSTATDISRGIHLSYNEDNAVVCPFGDSDLDGSLIISSNMTSGKLSQQESTATVDLDSLTATENVYFQIDGLQLAKRNIVSNTNRPNNRSMFSKRSPERCFKPRVNRLKQITPKTVTTDSYVDFVDLTQQVDDDSDIDVEIIAEWDSRPFINIMRENIKSDHNYSLVNHGDSFLSQNKQHKNPHGNTLKIKQLHIRDVKMQKKTVEQMINHENNLIERNKRLELKHLFEHLHFTVVENPSPVEPKIGIIRHALNEIRTLQEREQELLREKRHLAFLATNKRQYIRELK